jgi:hypothetical protein
MNITTQKQQTREKAQYYVEILQKEMQVSNYYKIANDETERQYRRNEANTWLHVKEQEIKQAIDIRDNMPIQDYTVISVTDCYNERETLKANEYKWNPENRSWYKKVLTVNVEAEIEAIKS